MGNNFVIASAAKNMEKMNFDIYTYIEDIIGDYSVELEKKTLPDRRQTTYLEAIKYTALLTWNAYNMNGSDDPDRAYANKDVLDTVLLSLHPKELVEEKDISFETKRALSLTGKFKDLILLNDFTEETAEDLVKAATNSRMSKSYPAQMCLMAWFLTLVSKMTGFRILGAKKMLGGGRIQKETEEIIFFLTTMQSIAQAMYEDNRANFMEKYGHSHLNWPWKRYQVQRDMYLYLTDMIEEF